MDKTVEITLEKQKHKQDALSQFVPDGCARREVFCSMENVQRSDWNIAAAHGLKSIRCVRVWADEYSGEEVVIVDGIRFAVYRTYSPNADEIELHLEQRAGV